MRLVQSAYHDRYADFFDRHGRSPSDPLGASAPAGGLPPAPATPDRLEGDYPLAAPGLTDGVYVVSEDVDVRLDCERLPPDPADAAAA